MKMKEIVVGKLSVWVRDDGSPHAHWDRVISSEVQQHYQFVNYSKLKRVVDVGAHIGAFGRYCLSQNPTCEIIGIEPDPDNLLLASKNVPPPNGVIPGYCGYDPAPKTIHQSMDNSGNHRIVPIETVPRGEWINGELRVDRYNLEDLLDFKDWDQADLLKIDCEGSEYDILTNAPPETLRRFRYLVGEYHGGAARFHAELEEPLERVFQMQQFFEAPDWGQFFMERKQQ